MIYKVFLQEQSIHTAGVAGSNPASPTILSCIFNNLLDSQLRDSCEYASDKLLTKSKCTRYPSKAIRGFML